MIRNVLRPIDCEKLWQSGLQVARTLYCSNGQSARALRVYASLRPEAPSSSASASTASAFDVTDVKCCCEKGEALNVAICPECLSASIGYSKAMAVVRTPPTPNCKDLDSDCEDVKDHCKCWTYAPERGMCPYLRSK